MQAPVLRIEMRISGRMDAEPSLHFSTALDWPGRDLPPAFSRQGFITLECFAACDAPWVLAWEAVEEWYQLGYLVTRPQGDVWLDERVFP
jgi:hypothetical protein